MNTNTEDCVSIVREACRCVDAGERTAIANLLRVGDLVARCVERASASEAGLAFIRERARGCETWIAVVGRDSERKRQVDDYLQRIQLSEGRIDCPFYVRHPRKKAKGDFGTPVVKIARDMLKLHRAMLRDKTNSPIANEFKKFGAPTVSNFEVLFNYVYIAVEKTCTNCDVLNHPEIGILGNAARDRYLRDFEERVAKQRERRKKQHSSLIVRKSQLKALAYNIKTLDTKMQLRAHLFEEQLKTRRAAAEIAADKKARGSIRSQLRAACRRLWIGK
jgi:hypothetical protein